MNNQLTAKKIISSVLILIGGIGYLIAALCYFYAIYFWIVATLHPNAPETTEAGLAGLGFFLEAIAGTFVAAIASVFLFRACF